MCLCILIYNNAIKIFLKQATPVVVGVDSKKEKIVLLWNAFYKETAYGLGDFGRNAFTKNKCKVDNCRLETNRSLLEEAAAVVFHVNGKDMDRFPRRTNRGQLFVYFLREPPPYASRFSRKYTDQFNLTMTYLHDSDIPIPISRVVQRVAGEIVDVKPYHTKYPASSRSRDVAWMVSHCDTASKRHVYVKALSRYINVDVYGACGNLRCAKKQTSKCMQDLERNYKFYLAFENSVCDDYVTEKLYRTLAYEIVPIVYGGADYRKLSPPNSYINILDYESPKSLAAHLKHLSANDSAYEAFFQWKPYWKFIGNNDFLRRGFCRLCEMLNRGDVVKTYRDVHKWYVHGRCNETIVEKVVKSGKLRT